MEARSSRSERDSQPLGHVWQPPSPPTAFESEPALIEPKSHRNLETGSGETTGRRNPGIGDRPLDERITGPMPRRSFSTLEVSGHLGRESESIQIPDIVLSVRERRIPHIYSLKEKTEYRPEISRAGVAIPHGSDCNSARVGGKTARVNLFYGSTRVVSRIETACFGKAPSSRCGVSETGGICASRPGQGIADR
jgi:hypothetical protein